MADVPSTRASLFGVGVLLVALRSWRLIAHARFGSSATPAEALIADLHRQVFSLTESNVELVRQLQTIKEEHRDIRRSFKHCSALSPACPGNACLTEIGGSEARGVATRTSAPMIEPGTELQNVHDLMWAEVEAGRVALRQARELLGAEYDTLDASSAALADVYGLLMMRFAGACSTLTEAYGLLTDDRVQSGVAASVRAAGESARNPYDVAAHLKSEASLQETFEVLSARLEGNEMKESRAIFSTVLGATAVATLAVTWPSLAAVARAIVLVLDYRMFLLKLSVLFSLASLLMFGGISYMAVRYARHASDHPV